MDLTSKRLFDNQMLKDFQNCNRYGYWRHERDLSPTKVATALVFGIGIHASMATHYRGGDHRAVALAFKEVWVDEFDNPEGDDKRNLNNGIFILEAYIDEHPIEHEPFTVLDVERGFLIPFDEDIVYCGTMDLVVENKSSSGMKGVTVIDHKTTSMWSNIVTESVNPNRQFTGYILGLKSLYNEVYGAMLNSIFVNKTKRNVRRIPTQRSDMHLAQFVVETMEIVGQWDHCKESGFWPQSTEYCIKWNRHCEYSKLCKQGKHITEVMIHPADFKVDPWDPIKERREAK